MKIEGDTVVLFTIEELKRIREQFQGKYGTADAEGIIQKVDRMIRGEENK